MNVLLAEMTMNQRLWCGMLGELVPRNGGIGRDNLAGQKPRKMDFLNGKADILTDAMRKEIVTALFSRYAIKYCIA